MIKNILLFIVLLSSIFLISCTNSEIIKITIPPNKIIEAPIQENFNQGIIKTDVIIQNTDIPQYTIYNNNFDKIEVYGIDKTRIQTILKDMNPKHFEKLGLIQFIYSNRQVTKSEINGMYYPDNKQITLWIQNESDGYVRYLVLHELKHHYCLTNEKENFDRCIKENKLNIFDNAKLFDYCYHKGCFLDTPIDKEYGYLK